MGAEGGWVTTVWSLLGAKTEGRNCAGLEEQGRRVLLRTWETTSGGGSGLSIPVGVESEGVTGRGSSGRGELIQAVRQECRARSWGAVAVAVCRESQTARVICQKWEWRCPLVECKSKAYSCRSVGEEYAAQRMRGSSGKEGRVDPGMGGVQVRERISVVRVCMRGVP